MCWEDYFLKLITICIRHCDTTDFLSFFQTDKPNILCRNQDFSRFLQIWLILSWLAENWNWNDYFLTPVSRGNWLRSIFSHYSDSCDFRAYVWPKKKVHLMAQTDTQADMVTLWLNRSSGADSVKIKINIHKSRIQEREQNLFLENLGKARGCSTNTVLID